MSKFGYFLSFIPLSPSLLSTYFQVVQIPPAEQFPDLVYVEDPAVVLGRTALITQMAPPTRAGEITIMQPVLEEMGYQIVDMKEPGAYLDGGDVMFTGRELLVGLSERTNAVSG